ncbi:sensor domain-containing diguanylate cyclase [Herbaspirillum sp. YR522]|uniref:sensor domain-containing diguanylate cyclase n=1 Tax=Herbaspirillum sp. YR522 TaxID=1144342 RepID=UPI00026F5CCD|nr:sensor domain-containing diguanylate cyclase [Herbaspirillum sp. YR522]EJN01762.1 diguanylate cyclase (GGDEF) domain-containing protein [Herbaspirillum sp. YR522]
MQSETGSAADPKHHAISYRARLFVILVCLVIGMTHVWQSWSARQSDVKNAQTNAGNMARALAQHANDAVQAADGLLLDVTDRIAMLGMGSPLISEMTPVLARIAEEMPQLDGLLIYDELGNWVVNSAGKVPAHANNADRSYFIHHRDNDTRKLLVGQVLRSRTTDHWVIPVSRRINHRDGSFAGVALATINIDYFVDLYRTFEIGQNGSIALLLRDGTLLTRHPFEPRFINRSFADSVIFTDLLPKSQTGSFQISSRIDGVHRYFSYQAVDKFPLVAVVALASEEALADWTQETLVYSAGVLLLLMIIASFGWRLVGQIELRLQAEQKTVQAMEALRLLNGKLELLAHQDGLTGLSNRRHFDDTLDKEYRRAARCNGELSLVLIDVDFFKQYNDIYGHQAGDECLRQIGRVLQQVQQRPADLAVRYGGEEMLVLLPDTGAQGAALVAEKIRAGIEALALPHSGNPVGVVTASAGVNTIRPDQHHRPPMGDLVGHADTALYEAKRGGRNQVRIAPTS